MEDEIGKIQNKQMKWKIEECLKIKFCSDGEHEL